MKSFTPCRTHPTYKAVREPTSDCVRCHRIWCYVNTHVAALFVDPKGIYPTLNDPCYADCWDEARDARCYAGPYPVVAHPPCNLWTNMAAVNWERYKKTPPAWYPGGSDGGCFAAALEAVRKHGGTLEHPAGSHAWEAHGLVPPPKGYSGWHPEVFKGPWDPHDGHCGYWRCEVWQTAYGHRARGGKRTWLLYCGQRPPFELRWAREKGTHVIGGGINTGECRGMPKMEKKEASATPIAFAKELVKLALHSQGTK